MIFLEHPNRQIRNQIYSTVSFLKKKPQNIVINDTTRRDVGDTNRRNINNVMRRDLRNSISREMKE